MVLHNVNFLQNLESKVQAGRRLSKRKESFIEMLHRTEVMSCNNTTSHNSLIHLSVYVVLCPFHVSIPNHL